MRLGRGLYVQWACQDWTPSTQGATHPHVSINNIFEYNKYG